MQKSERARRKPTESLGAYDLLLRGLANFYKWTRDGTDEALRLFYKAIELDADFSAAMPQPRCVLTDADAALLASVSVTDVSALLGLVSTATRDTEGTIECSSSKCFVVSSG